MNGNGDAVKWTRATIALVTSIILGTGTIAVTGFQARQSQAINAEQETRIRSLEITSAKIDDMRDEIRAQSEQIDRLRQEVKDLTRQVDRINR